jgi:hypothetical protein
LHLLDQQLLLKHLQLRLERSPFAGVLVCAGGWRPPPRRHRRRRRQLCDHRAHGNHNRSGGRCPFLWQAMARRHRSTKSCEVHQSMRCIARQAEAQHMQTSREHTRQLLQYCNVAIDLLQYCNIAIALARPSSLLCLQPRHRKLPAALSLYNTGCHYHYCFLQSVLRPVFGRFTRTTTGYR